MDKASSPAILTHDPKRMRFIVTQSARAADENAANVAGHAAHSLPQVHGRARPWQHGMPAAPARCAAQS